VKIARVQADGSIYLARIERSGNAVLLREESHHPAADVLREMLAAGPGFDADGPVQSPGSFRLLAPVANPSKFIGVGLNYHDHAEEGGNPVPDRPIIFLKGTNSIIGPTDPIRIDTTVTSQVDFEVELAIVIGRETGPLVPPTSESILGYTVCNDVTARDAQFSDIQWPRSKSFDTFGPLGPCIVTADSIDPGSLALWSEVSGVRMQNGTTANLIFTPDQVVAYLAQFMTFKPGDVITTGTPAGVGFARTPPRFLSIGDTVEVHVDGIGSCVNLVTVMDRPN
jgi:2-keto-4-pentenoate hydratase/2-oxohepta-3-ene-1,7-dioic acid hydratase in catechol pathway